MDHRVKRAWRLPGTILFLLLFVFTKRAFAISETNYLSLGVRSGFSQSGKKQTFYQTEAFSAWVPTRWRPGTNWTISPRVELTAGYLLNHGEDGFVGTVGPEMVVKYNPARMAVNMGVRATMLSRNFFEGRNFGIPFQITSHIGADWEMIHRWNVGYRFQHMSNSGLSSSNPGLN